MKSIVWWLLFSLGSVVAQNVRDSSLFAPLVQISYAYQFPGGDLAKRFGNNSDLNLSFSIKDKKKFIYGLSGNFIFSSNVKENTILDSLINNAGFIIDQQGNLASVTLSQRGFIISGHIGYLLNVWAPNKNSGIMFKASAGFMQHWIRIVDDANQVPQLNETYVKGYDRLTNGLMLGEFIGYLYLGNKRMWNFFAGIELTQAFTKNKRYNFDLMKIDDTRRLDLLYGLRVGWILPLYKRQVKEIYFY